MPTTCRPATSPCTHTGAEIVEFSPTDVLGQTMGVVMGNLERADQGLNHPSHRTYVRGTVVAAAGAAGEVPLSLGAVLRRIGPRRRGGEISIAACSR